MAPMVEPEPRPLSICVYCGSSTRVPRKYLDAASELGRIIGSRGHVLVWGGGSVGLMGAVAEGAQGSGGRVYGVIPSFLAGTEVQYDDAEDLVVTRDMR